MCRVGHSPKCGAYCKDVRLNIGILMKNKEKEVAVLCVLAAMGLMEK